MAHLIQNIYVIQTLFIWNFFAFIFNRPNVCTERKEELSDWNSPASSTESGSEEQATGLRQTTTSHNIGIHFSFNTCVEKSNKRTCTSV